MSDVVSREQLENQLDIMVHQHKEMVAQIEQLKTQQQIAVANANAAEGAIQVLQYLLSQCGDNSKPTETHASATEQEQDNGDSKAPEQNSTPKAGHDSGKSGENSEVVSKAKAQAKS